MEFNKNEQELIAYIHALMGDDDRLVHDFNDDKQFDYAVMMTTKHPDAANRPGALAHLKQLRQEHRAGVIYQSPDPATTNGWMNMFEIPGLGLSNTDGRIAADGFGTVYGGYSAMHLALVVQNNQTGDIVASGFADDQAGELLSVNTALPGSTASKDVTATMYYSFSPPVTGLQSGQSSGESASVKRKLYANVTGDPVLTHPVRRTTAPLNPKAINTGLGRPYNDQGGNTQFDYAFNQSNVARPQGRIPFVGQVKFSSAIKSPMQPGTTILIHSYVSKEDGGGGVRLDPADLNLVYNRFSISPDDNTTLRWNLPPAVSSGDQGAPIVFSNIVWPTETVSYFYLSVIVTLANNETAFAAVQSKMTPDEDALDGNLNIMPIEFIWHCLAEGTPVTMADGSTRPIEDIVAGDQVLNGETGNASTVEWTNRGLHAGAAYRLETDGETSLTLSANHIVFTPDGPRRADEVSAGDTVLTPDGSQRIRSCSVCEDFDGVMCNLATRAFDTDPAAPVANFVAAGLIVGDVNSQRAIKQARRRDIDWVKARTDPMFHPDIDARFARMTHR